MAELVACEHVCLDCRRQRVMTMQEAGFRFLEDVLVMGDPLVEDRWTHARPAFLKCQTPTEAACFAHRDDE